MEAGHRRETEGKESTAAAAAAAARKKLSNFLVRDAERENAA